MLLSKHISPTLNLTIHHILIFLWSKNFKKLSLKFSHEFLPAAATIPITRLTKYFHTQRGKYYNKRQLSSPVNMRIKICMHIPLITTYINILISKYDSIALLALLKLLTFSFSHIPYNMPYTSLTACFV